MWTGSNARRAARRDAGSDIRSAAGSLVGHHSGCSFPTLTPLAAPKTPDGRPNRPRLPNLTSPHPAPPAAPSQPNPSRPPPRNPMPDDLPYLRR